MESSLILEESKSIDNFCIVCYESKKTNIFELGCCGKRLCTSCHIRLLKSSLHNACPKCRKTFNEDLQGDVHQNLLSISASSIVISFREVEILLIIQGILLLWYLYENFTAIGDLAIGISAEYFLFQCCILLNTNNYIDEYRAMKKLISNMKLGNGYITLFYFWIRMMKSHVDIGIIFCLTWFVSLDEERQNSSWKIFHMSTN